MRRFASGLPSPSLILTLLLVSFPNGAPLPTEGWPRFSLEAGPTCGGRDEGAGAAASQPCDLILAASDVPFLAVAAPLVARMRDRTGLPPILIHVEDSRTETYFVRMFPGSCLAGIVKRVKNRTPRRIAPLYFFRLDLPESGAFTGCGIVIGHLCGGISRDGDKFRGDSRLAHGLLHKVYACFKDAYGTVLCKDVKKAKGGCPEVVGKAAKWATVTLLQEFTDYTPKDSEKPKK
jgi:hypothetical protein